MVVTGSRGTKVRAPGKERGGGGPERRVETSGAAVDQCYHKPPAPSTPAAPTPGDGAHSMMLPTTGLRQGGALPHGYVRSAWTWVRRGPPPHTQTTADLAHQDPPTARSGGLRREKYRVWVDRHPQRPSSSERSHAGAWRIGTGRAERNRKAPREGAPEEGTEPTERCVAEGRGGHRRCAG